VLYAIALGWPKDGKLSIRSLACDAGKIGAVSLLGHAGPLVWTQGEQGLVVTLPKKKPCQHALALKILGTGLKPSPAAQVQPGVRPAADGSITLLPETAELHGTQVRVEEQHGHAYLAAWDKPDEWVSWVLEAPAKSAYQVEVVYTAASGASALDVSLAGRKLTGRAVQTADWFSYRHANLGSIEIPQAGKQELVVRAHDAAAWRPVNIRSVKLKRIP